MTHSPSSRPCAAVLALLLLPWTAPSPVAGQERRPAEAPAATADAPRIVGTVRARGPDDGAALAYAMVEADGARAVLAGANGRYALEGVGPGLVRVVATHVGFAPAEVEEIGRAHV